MDYNKVSIKDMLTGKIEKSNSERGDISTGYRVVRMNGDGYMSKPCMEVSRTVSDDGGKKNGGVKKAFGQVAGTAGQAPLTPPKEDAELAKTPTEKSASEEPIDFEEISENTDQSKDYDEIHRKKRMDQKAKDDKVMREKSEKQMRAENERMRARQKANINKSASDMYKSLRDSGYSDEDIHKAVTGIVKSTVKKL